MEAPTAAAPAATVQPVAATERIQAVDVLRGFALLGILWMNIVSFALPEAAYFNPRVAGGDTGWNLWVWQFTYVFLDGRMRGIFSLVFGAGALLLITRAEERGAGASIADIYYRRILWLLLFGVLHAYLIWYGDILYPYALLGLILYPMRKLSVRALLIVAGVQVVLLTGMGVGDSFRLREMREKATKADQAAARGEKLTGEQEEAQKEWKDELKKIFPGPEEIKKETDAYRGGWVSAMKQRAKTVWRWHALPYYFPFFWDMLMMMLIGMALVKARVLGAERSYRFYGWMAAIGLAAGLPVNAFGAWKSVQVGFEPVALPLAMATYQIGRVASTLAYVALLLMIVKSGALGWLTRRLAAVGQTAFSNYISHSAICTLIFYGFGLGMFGKLERYQVYAIVPAIWVFNLAVSPVWLRHFRFGPLEWCWRSLTYWKRQPMRADEASARAAL